MGKAGLLTGLTSWRAALTSSYLVQYLKGILWTVHATFFQRLSMGHLSSVDKVGGPVEGLTVIITGPTSGIGSETAAALARRGAKVVLACRNLSKGEALKHDLERNASERGLSRPQIEVRQLNLSSLESVRKFCKEWEAEQRELHILINNAGIYSMGAPREETPDGFEAQMGCNHLCHFLLTMNLLPSLRRGAASKPSFGGRIVNVSSSVHMAAVKGVSRTDPYLKKRGAYSAERGYAQSKVAQILFTRELRNRLGLMNPIQVFAVHPGLVLTEVVRTLPRFIQIAYKIIMGVVLLTPEEGARASVYCATSPTAPAEGVATAGYFNANCKPMLPSRAAQDDEAAAWVWIWSAEQVGLTQAQIQSLLSA